VRRAYGLAKRMHVAGKALDLRKATLDVLVRERGPLDERGVRDLLHEPALRIRDVTPEIRHDREHLGLEVLERPGVARRRADLQGTLEEQLAADALLVAPGDRAVRLAAVGIEENRILLEDAEEHQEAEHREQLEGLPAEVQRDEREGHGERQRDEDGACDLDRRATAGSGRP